MNNKYVSWRRVSTFKQNRSGLGLEAQKEIIRYFIERDCGEWVADYEECYTGKELNGCVALHKAMEHAKSACAILIIAKTDRFRNTIEALQIYEEMGDGNIMFCDLPHTDKFTLTLFFALAEREALIVSIRTKQALNVKKQQGARLGGSSEKYRATYSSRTEEERHEIGMKRGATKKARYMADKSTIAFLRVLRNVFPEATTEESPANWTWGMITTKGENKRLILSRMKDYKELDGTLWPNWDLAETDGLKVQARISNYIGSLRRSVRA